MNYLFIAAGTSPASSAAATQPWSAGLPDALDRLKALFPAGVPSNVMNMLGGMSKRFFPLYFASEMLRVLSEHLLDVIPT